MAKRKAELEGASAAYRELVARSNAALDRGDFLGSLEAAQSSWAHIDDMIQFEQKHEEKEHESIEGIDIVLQVAPLVFDLDSLDQLETLLKERKRIERNTGGDFTRRLGDARGLLWKAWRLWEFMEGRDNAGEREIMENFAFNSEEWKNLKSTWERMAVFFSRIENHDLVIEMRTRMDAPCRAKCPKCGAIVRAPKFKFLDQQLCPKCRTQGSFVYCP